MSEAFFFLQELVADYPQYLKIIFQNRYLYSSVHLELLL